MSFGLLTVFGGDQPVKSIISTLMGLFIATIGSISWLGFPVCLRRSATARGIDFVVIICGIFGLAEVFNSIENPEEGNLVKQKIGCGISS